MIRNILSISAAAFVFAGVILGNSDCPKGSRDCFPRDRVGLIEFLVKYYG